METINLFGKTYKVSKQAKYSYYSSLFIIALVLIKTYKSKLNFKLLLPNLIIIIVACLHPYFTNCVSKGQCEEYGWYLAISNMLVAAMLFIAFIERISKN